MRRFVLFLVAVGVLVFVIVPYFVLPPVLENLVASNVQNRLNLSREPAVKLQSEPQWEVLRGRFSGGRIAAQDLDLGDIRAESATITVEDPFAIDVVKSIGSGALVPRGSPPGRLRLELSESEVTRLVRANAGFPINGLQMARDGVTVRSEASLLGLTVPVTVEGDVDVRGGSFVFEPRGAEAAGTALPGPLVEEILGGGFRHPVRDLPYGAVITDARTTDGSVVIRGRVPAVDLDALPPG